MREEKGVWQELYAETREVKSRIFCKKTLAAANKGGSGCGGEQETGALLLCV